MEKKTFKQTVLELLEKRGYPPAMYYVWHHSGKNLSESRRYMDKIEAKHIKKKYAHVDSDEKLKELALEYIEKEMDNKVGNYYYKEIMILKGWKWKQVVEFIDKVADDKFCHDQMPMAGRASGNNEENPFLTTDSQ
ncbi:MAG: hypothetical protein EAZ97_10585 [Bacteroidetes bacterium]|nr:MAG: hypothetical protein EAZ97_10585 [Bacteroidota bacterium]